MRKPWKRVCQSPNLVKTKGVAARAQTHRLESGDLAAGNVVDIEASLVFEPALGAAVANLGDALVGAVLGLEEHDGGPVVGFVLGEAARRAAGPLGEVVVNGRHGQVERVAAHNLVEMGGVADAGVDQGVDTVDDQLRASKPQHVLRSRTVGQQRNGRGEGSPLMHLDLLFF
jgi:hypothetical protein